MSRLYRKRHGAMWWIFIGWWLSIFPLIFLLYKYLFLGIVYFYKYLFLGIARLCKWIWSLVQRPADVWQAPESPTVSDSPPVAFAHPPVLERVCNVDLRRIDNSCDHAINLANTIVAIDVETTGLDRQSDRIVEIGIAEYCDGNLVAEYSSLVNPQRPISPSASAVNGITATDVADAPRYPEIAEQVAERIRGKMLIAHNASFDISFLLPLLELAETDVTASYVDTLSYARKRLKGVPNHKLDTLIGHYGIIRPRAHRALDDAKATAEIFLRCRADYIEAEHVRQEREKMERTAEREAAAKAHEEKYHDSPLYNVVFAFTGEFISPREEIEQAARDIGAIVRGNVSRNTDYLVVGDISNLPDWAIERKFEKADVLISQGRKVQKIDEDAFWEMIESAKVAFAAS